MAEYATLEQLDSGNYPLPIAYELQQLARIPSGEWWCKCKQLAHAFEFALRYCTIIALSEYRRTVRETELRSADVDALIADRIDNPNVDACAILVKKVMAVYRGREGRLRVPDLYRLCYTEKGSQSDWWGLVQRLQTLYTLMRSPTSRTHDVRLSGWYAEYLPVMGEFLQAFDFVKRYDLLRLLDWQESDGTFVWRVKVLKGPNLDPPQSYLEDRGEPFDEEYRLAIWNHEQERPLYLPPFAIFHECGSPLPNDRVLFSEDFYYYERHEHGELTYVGLRDAEAGPFLPDRPHRITLEKYIDIIEGFKREAPQGSRVATWPHLVKRCRALSWDQLLVFQRDKYDPGVYVKRVATEARFAEFLESDKIGFLVIGESGTGKTNLLCSLAERLVERGDAVILYNCADIRDEKPDIAGILERSLRLGTNVSDFLLAAGERDRGTGERRLYCLFDAINESKNPLVLLQSLVSLIRDIATLESLQVEVKVVLSCRSDSWVRLRSSFVGDRYFYGAGGDVAVPLERFELDELEDVYAQYQRKFRSQTDFAQLTEAVRSFVRDPLMMRLLAESFQGQKLPPDPKTRRVFDNYIRIKIGYQDAGRSAEDAEEKRFVERLITKMLELQQEELDIKRDLRDNPELRQRMLDPSMTSPYWQLRDKGVLTAFGRRDLADRNPQKVKFTYDRVFEYLLQDRLFPKGELTVNDVDQIVQYIHRSRDFPSLWGAIRVALGMHFDERSSGCATVLTTLVGLDDSQVRAMMVDMLVEYGFDRASKVEAYLIEVLLELNSEEAGQIAVQVAYELSLEKVLEECLVHPIDWVKQLATQNVFYLWQRQPEKGAAIVASIYERIEGQWKRILPSALKNVWQGARGIHVIRGLGAFLDLVALFVGYAYMAGPEIRPIGELLARFVSLISHGPLTPLVRLYLRSWGQQLAGGVTASPPTYGTKLLSVIFDYPPDHPLRESIAVFADYLDPGTAIPEVVLNRMFAVAQEPIATPMFIIASIFYTRGKDLGTVFRFCERLFYEGNVYSKNLAVRIASLIVYIENLGGKHLQFLEEMLLELWNGQEATYRYPAKQSPNTPARDVEIPVGYLHIPVLAECRTRTGGASEFLERILRLPWHGNPSHRLVRVLQCLEDAVLLAGATRRTRITAILETVRQWVSFGDARVRAAMVDLLSIARSFYPAEVDQFLDGLTRTSGEQEGASQAGTELVRDVYERFKRRSTKDLLVGSFLVGVPWLQQNSGLFRGIVIETLKQAMTGESADWEIPIRRLGAGVGSLSMLREIARLLGSKV